MSWQKSATGTASVCGGDGRLFSLYRQQAARLCDELRWWLARIWVPDESGSWIILDEYVREGAPASAHAATAGSAVAASLAERVRAAREVVVVARVDEPVPLGNGAGIGAGVAVPVHSPDGAIAAVLEFFSASAVVDEATTAALGRMASWQITELVRRESLAPTAEQLRLIFDAMPGAVGLLAPGGTFIAANRALCELTGRSSAELARLTLADLTSAPGPAAPMEPGRSTGEPALSRQLVLRPDGTQVAVEVELAAAKDAGAGELLQVVFLADAGRRERERERETWAAAAREHQRQATLFNHILEHLQSAVFVANTGGEIIMMNRAARALTRVPAADPSPNLSDAIGRVFEADGVTPMRMENTVMARTLRGDAPVEQLVVIRDEKNPDGTWVLSTGQPLVENGKKIGAVVLAYDVTALKREENKFRSLLEAAPDALVIISDSGQIILVNSQAEAMFGYPRSELIGNHVEKLLPERLRNRHQEHRSKVSLDPELWTMGSGLDLIGRRSSGSEFPIEVSLRPLVTHRGQRVIAAIRDITVRKQVAQALAEKSAELEQANASLVQREAELRRSNADLNEFAYAASHDLRAPLRAIRSLAGFLAEDLEPHLAEASLQHIALLQARVRRMEALLVSLLDYSRAGHGVEQIAKVRLTDVVNHAREIASVPHTFVLKSSLPDATLDTVSVLLERVFLNLITNAVKHHDRAQGSIEFGGIDRGDLLELWVQDDGPGIPAQYHERVFGLFQTLKPRDDVEGSGMGLALVRKIISRAGGQIHIESSGRGSRFVFTWPKEWRK